MLIVMKSDATPGQVKGVCDLVESMGLTAYPMPGAVRTAIGVTGNKSPVDADKIHSQAGVREVIHVTRPYMRVGRESQPKNTLVKVGDVTFGGDEVVIMAGPCSIESRDQAMTIAEHLAKAGVKVFRGGAFKPRTSPYSFQGLREEGLKILAEVREQFGLRIVTEVVDTETLGLVADYADIVQIGARNMQNYSLLRRVGQAMKPVLLKRGMAATLDEFLMAAEYIIAENNPNIILCERGVRTFNIHTRNTLDLSAIPWIKKTSHLPIVTDPSHATGLRDKVAPLSRASIAAGADGLLIEVHHDPASALSDGPQSITPAMFDALMVELKAIASVLNRTCA